MIAVVIPTLDTERGESIASVAKATAGCEANFVVITDRQREGFTRTVNRGMRAVGQVETCLLNDDIEAFQQGWLAELHARLARCPDIGLIGPAPGNGYWLRTPESWPQYTYRAEHLSFWCVLIRQEMRQEGGLLDESYIHYSSDYAYCDLAKQLGWEVALCSDLNVTHSAAGSGGQQAWLGHDLRLYHLRKRRRHTDNPYFPKKDMLAFEPWLKALNPRRVLEWGAGRSTIYWPSRIADLECWVSIEHHFRYWRRFYSQVGESVDLRFLTGDEYLLPAEDPTYDLIIVDGTRRNECLVAAHRLLKSGGVVILHDWGRREYQEGIASYAKREILTLGGRLEINGDVTQGLLVLREA